MLVIITYLIITAIALILVWSIFLNSIDTLLEYKTTRKMLRMELTNEIANTTALICQLELASQISFNHNSVQEYLLIRQLLESTIHSGEDLVVYIEKCLFFDARQRNSTYNFYARKEVYHQIVGLPEQFHISLWIKYLINLLPDYINIELCVDKVDHIMIIHELRKGNQKYDFETLDQVETQHELPGEIEVQSDGKLFIKF